jgi:hypothetical protein
MLSSTRWFRRTQRQPVPRAASRSAGLSALTRAGPASERKGRAPARVFRNDARTRPSGGPRPCSVDPRTRRHLVKPVTQVPSVGIGECSQ